MRVGSRIRGLRLGTKLLLLGMPLALLFVPWVSFLLLSEMERLSVQMQSNQQRQTARNIAISFNGLDDLFADLPVDMAEYEALVAPPIRTPARPPLNGSDEDWGARPAGLLDFGPPEGEDGAFSLRLGTHGRWLYAYLEVADDDLVYRDPERLRLDNADQVRMAFIQPDGEDGRIALTLSEGGYTTAYRMEENWALAAGDGAPESAVGSFVRSTDAGYSVELAIPFCARMTTDCVSLLGARRFFSFSVVDVDDAELRAIRSIEHTLPSSPDKESFELVAFHSRDLLDILERLGYSGMHILVVDAQRRIRATIGSPRTVATVEESWQARALGWLQSLRGLFAAETPARAASPAGPGLDDEVTTAALAGEPITVRRRIGDMDTILAGHPIVSADEVIGMVAVEQNLGDILFFQREVINNIALVSVSSFAVVLLCLMLFAGRLTWRVGHLRRDAAQAIDESGRLRQQSPVKDTAAADEIGDLARSISHMLNRLHQHHTFLEKMPRTLRHEINNPLNAVNTSLEHLAQESDKVRDSKYFESAKRGVLRIGAIVQNLADAASLEDSLAADDLEVIDLKALIESYVRNCALAHPGHRVHFHGVPGPVLARVADDRIEQMLDKLIDNAVDFHRPDSAIRVQLDVVRDTARISVANRGPTLPAEAALFESMMSSRPPGKKLHFGLGLYVVRVIAEQHGGSVHAANLPDRSGVAIMVTLPLASEAEQAGAAPPARDGKGI